MCGLPSTICRQNLYFLGGLLVGITFSIGLFSRMENICPLVDNPGSVITLPDDYIDEYEPKINLAGKPQRAKKTPQTLVRPRYYSTELGIRQKLFIAVSTSQATISSRGVAFNKTAAHVVDKIMYFIDAPGPQKLNISMPGIVGFTDTRKILKPFHLIKYIADNYLDEYDFFFIVKDSTYVKARTLYDIVQGISVSQEVHAGSEKKDKHTAFCTLDAGLLLSNTVLRKVHSNLDWCVKNAFSDSDSDNVGRCILHATDIPCETVVQGLSLHVHKLSKSVTLDEELQILSRLPVVDELVSIYPVFHPSVFYTLHAYFCKIGLAKLNLDISTLTSEVINTSYISPGGRESLSWPIGATSGNLPKSRFDVLRWDYFTLTHLYPDSDFSNLRELVGSEKSDIEIFLLKHIVNTSVTWMHSHYEGVLQFRHLINGYRRFDPARGLDYKLDLAFKDKRNGHEVHKRLEVSKPLGRVEVVPIPYVTENSRVSLIVVATADTKTTVIDFIQQYNSVCMEKKDKTFLLLVLMYDPHHPGKGNKDDIFLELKQTAIFLSDRHKRDGGKIAWVSVKLPDAYDKHLIMKSLLNFAAMDLAIRKLSPESLIFFVQSNAELRQDLINRVRMNTIQHVQVYSPIPFSEFHPDIVYNADFPRSSELDVNKNVGHYDSMNTGCISFYGSDYLSARKAYEGKLPIVQGDKDLKSWISLLSSTMSRRENSDLMVSLIKYGIYSLFVRASDLHVLRAVEPGLRLKHVNPDCISGKDFSNVSVPIMISCSEARARNLGSRSSLASLLLEFQSHRISVPA